jgi:hypothetical protein
MYPTVTSRVPRETTARVQCERRFRTAGASPNPWTERCRRRECHGATVRAPFTRPVTTGIGRRIVKISGRSTVSPACVSEHNRLPIRGHSQRTGVKGMIGLFPICPMVGRVQRGGQHRRLGDSIGMERPAMVLRMRSTRFDGARTGGGQRWSCGARTVRVTPYTGGTAVWSWSVANREKQTRIVAHCFLPGKRLSLKRAERPR